MTDRAGFSRPGVTTGELRRTHPTRSAVDTRGCAHATPTAKPIALRGVTRGLLNPMSRFRDERQSRPTLDESEPDDYGGRVPRWPQRSENQGRKSSNAAAANFSSKDATSDALHEHLHVHRRRPKESKSKRETHSPSLAGKLFVAGFHGLSVEIATNTLIIEIDETI